MTWKAWCFRTIVYGQTPRSSTTRATLLTATTNAAVRRSTGSNGSSPRPRRCRSVSNSTKEALISVCFSMTWSKALIMIRLSLPFRSLSTPDETLGGNQLESNLLCGEGGAWRIDPDGLREWFRLRLTGDEAVGMSGPMPRGARPSCGR